MFPYPNGPFGDMMPYSNFHSMNLDWVIKIAKDFLDQYSNIQETITTGLTELDEKAEQLQNALDAWYNEHSEDIAQELTRALEEAVTAFNAAADTKAANTLESIPADYQTISRSLYASYAPFTDYTVVYNYITGDITFPAGTFFVNNGGGYGIQTAQVVNVANILENNACNFFLKQNNTVYAKAWNTLPDDTTDHFLGYIHGGTVHINGVPDDRIVVTNGTSFTDGLYHSPCGVAVSSTEKIIYNYNTKDLTIPGGYSPVRGFGKPRNSTIINVASELQSGACSLFMRWNGSIYAKNWVDCKAESYKDTWIGYIFNKHVFIIGADPSVITVIDSMTKNVFCFGDSITAGVGATLPYHTWWKDWKPDAAFYNWGVGSTGYVRETSDNVCVGNGVEGRGSWRQESGNNSVIKVMQSLTDVTIPAMTIQAGTNDYGNNISANDFRTAVQNTLDYAQTRTAYILVITPFRRVNGENTNSAGLKLSDYANIIKEECDARGIFWVDGYKVGINPDNLVSKNAFMPDGLHPDNNGQGRIGRYTLDILNTMLTNNG